MSDPRYMTPSHAARMGAVQPERWDPERKVWVPRPSYWQPEESAPDGGPRSVRFMKRGTSPLWIWLLARLVFVVCALAVAALAVVLAVVLAPIILVGVLVWFCNGLLGGGGPIRVQVVNQPPTGLK